MMEKEIQDRLDTLYTEQTIHFANVRRAVSFIRVLQPEHRVLPILQSRETLLQQYWTECRAADKEINTLAARVDQSTRNYFAENRFTNVEVEYLNALDQLALWRQAVAPQRGELHVRSHEQLRERPAETNVKLPRLTVPIFSGKFTEWAAFKDSFVALISSSTTLSEIEKLHYLKASVQGEANDLICNVQIVAGNFVTAWNLLEDRFSNKRARTNAHFAEIMKLASIKHESASNLLNFRNTVTRNIAALRNLDCPTQHYSAIFIYILTEKLDKKTQRDWEISIASNSDLPSFEAFDNFLVERIRVLESLSHADPPSKLTASQSKSNLAQSQSRSHNQSSKHVSVNNSVVSQSNGLCLVCNKDHKIYQCPKFNDSTITERYDYIKSRHLCSNCLGKGHKYVSCTSKFACRQCGQKHHTLLHRDSSASQSTSTKGQPSVNSNDQPSPDSVQSHVSISNRIQSNHIVLPTVKVWVKSNSNRKLQVRALLDQGSTWSFVSHKVAKLLGAQRIRVFATMSGLGGTFAGTSSSAVQLTIVNPHSTESLKTQAIVLPRITSYSSAKYGPIQNFSHLKNLELADDPASSEEIQLLIGADLYGAIILNEVKKGSVNEPIAQNTVFGWVISGPLSTSSQSITNVIPVHQSVVLSNLNSSIRKFWEIESIPAKHIISPEDESCESHFVDTHSRAPDGRYIVRLPFISNEPPKIGHSRFIAERLLKRGESSLAKNPDHQRAYALFMSEYESLTHMSKVSKPESSRETTVYLPHHPVFREKSQTTKLRVVFNASCKTSNGTSINDHLVTGPKLQSDLHIVLSQWRAYPIVFIADIAKMYRQILVDPRDRDYQRVLWRSRPTEPIAEYQLNTVTYGTRPAPYLAHRVLKQLVLDEGEAYPLASIVLEKDTFVDDLLFGGFDELSASNTRLEVTNLLKKAQLEPRKWASNSLHLISDIDPADHGLAWDPLSPDSHGVKVLGVQWDPTRDVFHFSIKLDVPETLTKRRALSILAQLFDPLGWVAPVIIKGKIMMQNLWLNDVQWDENLSPQLTSQWVDYFESLSSLSTVTIPRWNRFHPNNRENQLHGFADASTEAYGAVIYLRTINPLGEVSVSLIISKTKVAPLKQLKIHRLELQAALLLAELTAAIRHVRAFADLPVQCWTDSSITLSWLRKHALHWKLLGSNRVADIHALLPNHSWRHVPTLSNPADLVSRGVKATDLLESALWWKGPAWLADEPDQWPNAFPEPPADADMEIKAAAHVATIGSPDPLKYIALKFSSWIKVIRVIAYVLKYIQNLKTRVRSNRTPPIEQQPHVYNHLTATELAKATTLLYQHLQRQMFPTELRDLESRNSASRKSAIIALNPIYDPETKLLRVGGRLRHSDLPYERQHPIILRAHPVVTALIRHIHVQCLHGGVKLTLSTLRQTVWLVQPRPQIKSAIHKCMTCTRLRAKRLSQFMADLPKSRVSKVTRAFTHCGVDYAGPVQVRMSSGRGHKSSPCWISVFVCFAVKAIHLELVSDYSSAAFIAAYKRFVSRRGLPSRMQSDCGTTFQGANRLLHEEFRKATSDAHFHALLARDSVAWIFNPPAAPHFGGLWEAGVKSVKHHLNRILVNRTPTYEELTTLLCQIESVLNSRPLEPLHDTIDDLNPLTPGHFLIGGPLNAVPQQSLIDINTNRLSRWQIQQQLVESFWKAWSRDYIQSLQTRTKWRVPEPQVKVGQMVLLKGQNLPPGKWNLARIVDCHPGPDGHIRVVKLKTAVSEYVRPIAELVLLPTDLDNVTPRE